MAAREDEPQAVVRDRALRRVCRVIRQPLVLLERGKPRDLRALLLEALPAAQPVDGLVAARADERA